MRKEDLQRFYSWGIHRREVRSSGLGLSISYGIIHRHHGEIQVESREGMGTTFRIELPISKKEKDRREEEDGERSSAILHHPGH